MKKVKANSSELAQIFERLYQLFLQNVEETKEWVEVPDDFDEGFHDWIDGEVGAWLLTQPVNRGKPNE